MCFCGGLGHDFGVSAVGYAMDTWLIIIWASVEISFDIHKFIIPYS